MKTISLNGAWRLCYGPQSAESPSNPLELAQCGWPEIAASVPGNVEIDLERAGVIEPPEFAARIHDLRKYEAFDWWYSREFCVDAATPNQCANLRAELVFEGLDCFATCWVNGELAGESANALVAQRFDVSRLLRQGANNIAVRIASATLAGRRHVVAPGEHAMAVNFESLHVRNPPHCWGWDIMPRLVSAGIWRGARLEFPPATRWRAMYVATREVDVAARRARVVVDWDFETDRDIDSLRVRLRLVRNGRVAASALCHALGTHGRAELAVEDAEFWWPLGSGDAALYEFTAELLDADGRALDIWREDAGLRTVELRRTELTTPEGGGEFLFVVNGEPVFIKGTNWVPLDALHSRDAAALPEVFPMVVELGCNMLRCWGGNVYEDREFFRACDRAGVMVWQDFAMGCALYPQDDEFRGAIRREAEAVVAKLRNHPSLVLWAGNNECDEAFEWAGMGGDPNREDLITRQTLPAVIRRWDPLRAYLPSSPFRGPAFYAQGRPAPEVLPEQHLWGARDDFKGATYTASSAHFASEIGYHGCPSRESLERFIPAAELWPCEGSASWLAHAVQPHPEFHSYDYRIGLMSRQTAVLFGEVPGNLDDYIHASQASQAEALKFFIEWFRIAKWRRTGILWWNLRDGWPIISDAVVDYYNVKKLAYDVIRRSQSPVAALCSEPQNGLHELVIVNDRRAPMRGKLRAWQSPDPAASITASAAAGTLWEGDFEVDANGRAAITTLPVQTAPAMWIFEWTLSDGATGWNHYLAGPRPFDLQWHRRIWASLPRPAAESQPCRAN